MFRLVGLALLGVLAVGKLSVWQEEKPVLGVFCMADKASYTSSDSLNLTITLENHGSSDFYIFRTVEWGWAGIRYRLTDSAGNIVPEPRHIIPPPPPPPLNKSQLVGLSPGYFFGTHVFFNLSPYNLRPGVYNFQVAYQSPYPKEESFGLPMLTFADGAFLSNKIQFEIRSK